MASSSAAALKNRTRFEMPDSLRDTRRGGGATLRAARAVCLALLALLAAASCTTANDTEDYVPSQPGAVQPKTNGHPIDEATACADLSKAEASARSMLGCDAAKHTCPDYIRPAGSEDCFVYDQGSVTECAKTFGMFTDCTDFDLHPCIVTAKSPCAAGDTGEGGMGGIGGAPAEGGAAGMVALSSSAGAGGSP